MQLQKWPSQTLDQNGRTAGESSAEALEPSWVLWERSVFDRRQERDRRGERRCRFGPRRFVYRPRARGVAKARLPSIVPDPC